MPTPRTRTRNPSSPLFGLVAAVVIIAALYFAKEVLLPLALAVLLSFLLTPLANRLERWGLPRIPSVLAVVCLAFCVIGVLIWVVSLQALDLSTKLQTYKGNIVAKVSAVVSGSGPISKAATTLEDLSKEIASKTAKSTEGATANEGGATEPPAATPKPADIEREPPAVPVKFVEGPSSVISQISDWLGPLVAPLATAGLVAVLVIFMLVNREDQRNRLIQLFGTSNLHVTTEALTDAATRVTRFLRMQFLINAGYGTSVAIALTVIGVPNAVMWGVLGFMLRFLPYVGPIIAATMPIAVSAAVSSGWMQPLLVLGWYIVLELVVNNLVEPWVYGSTIGVSPVGIIIAAIFWTWLWGPIGLVLAMPLSVCLVVLANYVPQLRFVTVLFGDQPALSPAERTYQRLLSMDGVEVHKVANQYLKSAPLAEYYDDVLIPSLALAERDRHAGLLADEQEDFIEETAEELVDELSRTVDDGTKESDKVAAPQQAAPVKQTRARVLCIPLRDHADQTCTRNVCAIAGNRGVRRGRRVYRFADQRTRR